MPLTDCIPQRLSGEQGIGLATVYRVVKRRHHGEIRAESVLGQGPNSLSVCLTVSLELN